jgi:hypothetical protein
VAQCLHCVAYPDRSSHHHAMPCHACCCTVPCPLSCQVPEDKPKTYMKVGYSH